MISGDVFVYPQHTTSLILQDNVTITNDNYFPIVIDTLNISLAISWVGGVQSEVRVFSISSDKIMNER